MSGPGRPDVDARPWLPDLTCAARSDAPVLITGDRDADLRTVATAIHRGSRRARGPLMMIDCAEASDVVIESRLFGTAADGAAGTTPGLFDQADRGTLFLVRVDAMSGKLQARLLEFLEGCQVRRVGAQRAHARVDVRLISSAARRLFEQRVGAGFRRDLFYRLNTIHLVVPPGGGGGEHHNREQRA